MRNKQLTVPVIRVVALACVVCAPGALYAQVAAPVTKARTNVASNSCREITNLPSALVGSREGIALLKMQNELASATYNISVHGDSVDGRQSLRQSAILRRDVDSLAKYYVRSLDSMPRITVRGSELPKRVLGTSKDSLNRVIIRSGGDVRYFDAHGGTLSEAARRDVEMMIRELEPRVTQLARGQAPMSVEFTFSNSPRTSGYMGLVTSGLKITSSVNGAETVSFCEYPAVESVEPGSPADKAGVITNDTLIAFNNRDLLQWDVNYSRLLVPGDTVRVRLRRAGHTRTLPVAIVRRPGERPMIAFERIPCEDAETRTACDARITASMRGFMLPNPSMPPSGVVAAGGGGGMMTASASAPRGAPSEMRARISIPTLPFYASPDATFGMFAGARITAISGEFASNMGFDPGLLVMDVMGGTSAASGGLQAGEVINEVNGVPVRDFNTFRQALLTKSRERSASLLVGGKSAKATAARPGYSGTRVVVVRW